MCGSISTQVQFLYLISSMQVVHYLHEAGDNSALSAAMLISIIRDPFSSQKQLEEKFCQQNTIHSVSTTVMKQMITSLYY